MGESRRRFTEYTEAILDALETGYIEYDGELYQQPRIADPPAPAGQLQGPHVRVGGLARSRWSSWPGWASGSW